MRKKVKRALGIGLVLVLLMGSLLATNRAKASGEEEDLKSRVIQKIDSPYNEFNLYAPLDTKDSNNLDTNVFVGGTSYSSNYSGSPSIVDSLIGNSFGFVNDETEFITVNNYAGLTEFWGYSNLTLGAVVKDRGVSSGTTLEWSSEDDFRGFTESETTWVTEDGSLQLGIFEGYEDYSSLLGEDSWTLYDTAYSGRYSLKGYGTSSSAELTKGQLDSREFEPEYIRAFLWNVVDHNNGLGVKGSIPEIYFRGDSNGGINIAGQSTGYSSMGSWEKVELENIDYSSETVGSAYINGNNVLNDISFNSSNEFSTDQSITYFRGEGTGYIDSITASRSHGSSISKVMSSSNGYFEGFTEFNAHADLGGAGEINATIQVSDDEFFSTIKDSKTITLNDGPTTADISSLSRGKYVRIKTEMGTDDLLNFPRVHFYSIETDPGYSIMDLGGSINLRTRNNKPVLRVKDSSNNWHEIVGDQELTENSYTFIIGRYNQNKLELYYNGNYYSKEVGPIDIDVYPSERKTYIGSYGGDQLVANADLGTVFALDKALTEENIDLMQKLGLYKYGSTRNLEIMDTPEIDLGGGPETYLADILVNTTDPNSYLPLPKIVEDLNGSELVGLRGETYTIDSFKWVNGSEISYGLPLSYEELGEEAYNKDLIDSSLTEFVYNRDFSLYNPLDKELSLVFSFEPEDLGFGSLDYPDFSIMDKDLLVANEGSTSSKLYNMYKVPPTTTENYTLEGEFSFKRDIIVRDSSLDIFKKIVSFQNALEILNNTVNSVKSGETPKAKVINLSSEATFNDVEVRAGLGIPGRAEIIKAKALTGTKPEIETKIVDHEYLAIIPPGGFENGETSIKILYQPVEKGFFHILGFDLNFLDLDFSNIFGPIKSLLGLKIGLEVIN